MRDDKDKRVKDAIKELEKESLSQKGIDSLKVIKQAVGDADKANYSVSVKPAGCKSTYRFLDVADRTAVEGGIQP
jgi:hypothetical protein